MINDMSCFYFKMPLKHGNLPRRITLCSCLNWSMHIDECRSTNYDNITYIKCTFNVGRNEGFLDSSAYTL